MAVVVAGGKSTGHGELVTAAGGVPALPIRLL